MSHLRATTVRRSSLSLSCNSLLNISMSPNMVLDHLQRIIWGYLVKMHIAEPHPRPTESVFVGGVWEPALLSNGPGDSEAQESSRTTVESYARKILSRFSLPQQMTMPIWYKFEMAGFQILSFSAKQLSGLSFSSCYGCLLSSSLVLETDKRQSLLWE